MASKPGTNEPNEAPPAADPAGTHGPWAQTERSGGGRAVRVLVADDDDGMREALASLVRAHPGIELAGEAADAGRAIEVAGYERPDVALIDVRMPGGGGPRATREIRSASPGTRIVALSAYGDRAAVMQMLGAGAVGYLVKGTDPAEIVDTIRRTARGEARLSDEITASVVGELGEELGRRERESEARRLKVDRIQRALAPGAIGVVFQPIFDLRTARIVGFEALARFEIEPRRGPHEWFAEAAQVGRLAELEMAAAAAAVSHLDVVPTGLFLSVNISPSTVVAEQFPAGLPQIPAERLTLEVTEHAPVADYDELKESLADMRADGMRLAVDDAGAGYSNLHHILWLDPDLIKLDLTLTRGIDADPRRKALAAALIAFAEKIDAAIVAEGIETAAEHEALRALGVTYGQGYHLGRPGSLPGRTA